MCSLGSHWLHDNLCRCYGVPDLLRVPSTSSCGRVPKAKGSSYTVLVCKVTVWSPLFFTWSLLRILQMFPLEPCGLWQTRPCSYYRGSEIRCYYTSRHNITFYPFCVFVTIGSLQSALPSDSCGDVSSRLHTVRITGTLDICCHITTTEW
jgi:hypothetical protein